MRQRTSVVRGVLIAGLLWCLVTGCATSPKPLVVRVLSYNIHHGRGTDGNFDYERLAAVIRSARPDVVALQEVDRGTRRVDGADQPSVLAELTGLRPAYGRAMDYDGGEYGEALLFRFAADEPVNHALPHSEGHEPRAALAVRMTPAAGPAFTVVGTHLDHTRDPADREAQARRLAELFGGGMAGEGASAGRPSGDVPSGLGEEPCLIVGDLNATPDSEAMRILLSRFVDGGASAGLTFPSDVPERRIDYVLYRPEDRWRVIESRVLDEAVASDHRPLLVVLELSRD